MRAVIFIIFCFLLWIIYQDLTRSPLLQGIPRMVDGPSQLQTATYTSVRMQVQPGDTMLSLTEKINGNRTIDIEQLVKDFKTLNPEIDNTALSVGQYYNFPLYH